MQINSTMDDNQQTVEGVLPRSIEYNIVPLAATKHRNLVEAVGIVPVFARCPPTLVYGSVPSGVFGEVVQVIKESNGIKYIVKSQETVRTIPDFQSELDQSNPLHSKVISILQQFMHYDQYNRTSKIIPIESHHPQTTYCYQVQGRLLKPYSITSNQAFVDLIGLNVETLMEAAIVTKQIPDPFNSEHALEWWCQRMTSLLEDKPLKVKLSFTTYDGTQLQGLGLHERYIQGEPDMYYLYEQITFAGQHFIKESRIKENSEQFRVNVIQPQVNIQIASYQNFLKKFEIDDSIFEEQAEEQLEVCSYRLT